MSKIIRAFLIDSEQERVSEVTLSVESGSSYKDMKKYAGSISGIITIAATLIIRGKENTLYVDDEGLLHGHKKGFTWNNQVYQALLIGSGIIEGTDEHGCSCTSNMTLEEVQASVIFKTFTEEEIESRLSDGFTVYFKSE